MKKNFIFIIAILLMLSSIGHFVYSRVQEENDLAGVSFAMVYSDLEWLAEVSQMPVEDWLSYFKDKGLNHVLLKEESIQSSGRPIDVEVLMNLKKDLAWTSQYPQAFVDLVNKGNVDLNDVVLLTLDKNTYVYLKDKLLAYPNDFYTLFESQNQYAILLDGHYDDLIFNDNITHIMGSEVVKISLGFNQENIEVIESLGLDVMLVEGESEFSSGEVNSSHTEILKTSLRSVSNVTPILNQIREGFYVRNNQTFVLPPLVNDQEGVIINQAVYDDLFDQISKLSLPERNGIVQYSSLTKLHVTMMALGIFALMIFISRFYLRLSLWLEYALFIVVSMTYYILMHFQFDFALNLLAILSTLTISILVIISLVMFAKERYLDHQIFKFSGILIRSIVFTLAISLVSAMNAMIYRALLSTPQYQIATEDIHISIYMVIAIILYFIVYNIEFGYNRSLEDLRKQVYFKKDFIKVLSAPIKVSHILFAIILYTLYHFVLHPKNIMVEGFENLKWYVSVLSMILPSIMLYVYVIYKGYKKMILPMGIISVMVFSAFIQITTPLSAMFTYVLKMSSYHILIGFIIGLLLLFLIELLERLVKRLLKVKYKTGVHKELGA